MSALPDAGRKSAVIATRAIWLSNKLTSSASATYAKLGVGFVEARIVLALGRRPPVAAARLAEILGVDPAAVSRGVRDLKARGLVEEARGMVRLLTLTPAGRALKVQIEAVSKEREARMLRSFSPAETETLLAALERMLAHMEDVADLAEDAKLIAGGRGG